MKNSKPRRIPPARRNDPDFGQAAHRYQHGKSPPAAIALSQPIIQVRNLSKVYQLGSIGAQSLKDELAGLWEKWRGRWRRPDAGGQGQAGGPPPKGEFWALRDVSFDVQPGEIVGIIGRNGAGKSTLLKILSRITQQTTGEITLRGRVASLLEVGTGFHPDLTGRENVFLNGAILGMTKAEIRTKLDEIIAFAEVEQFIDTPVKRYSSGMYVRLAFAVAAHLEPEILIVDEVLAVGDLQFQKKCLGKMGQIGRTGRTVLFVSHNMAAVRNLCSRAILLNQGNVEVSGAVEHVIGRFLSASSAEFEASIALPPGDSSSPARGTRLESMSATGERKSNFLLNEPWRIRLEFEILKPLEHVLAAVGLRNVETVSLVTWWSAPADLQPGKYSVEFLCDLPFSAGGINFVIGISSHERTVYYLDGVGRVTISEVASEDQPLRASGTGILVSLQRPPIAPSESHVPIPAAQA